MGSICMNTISAQNKSEKNMLFRKCFDSNCSVDDLDIVLMISGLNGLNIEHR